MVLGGCVVFSEEEVEEIGECGVCGWSRGENECVVGFAGCGSGVVVGNGEEWGVVGGGCHGAGSGELQRERNYFFCFSFFCPGLTGRTNRRFLRTRSL